MATAVIALALLPLARAAAPAWFVQARAAAVARAQEPLADQALDAARVEVARAAAAGLPELRLGERSRLGLDAAFTLELEAGVRVPLWAPAVAADRRLTGARLTATRRQLAAERRAHLRDDLAAAVGLLATGARLRALDALAAALRTAGAAPSVPPPLQVVDVRLLAASRSAQRRRAEALRQALTANLGVRVPPVEDAPAPASGAPASGAPASGAPSAREAPDAARDPLGFVVAQLEPDRCLAASDDVARARLAVEDASLSAALARARARARVELELGGSATLGGEPLDASYALKAGLSVRLPPWSAATGSASLAVGAAGLEQALDARWPNRQPAAAPAAASAAPDAAPEVADAAAAVRQQLDLLVGQEADLMARRRILLRALAQPAEATLAGAYRSATLALRLADADEALGVTRLDAALLCGALPP
ncbi:MAG TPA: hypothetical protein VKB31_07260 [Trueperaceae bacterium]|nr:hypothetical protein [Trueperaceae bacterium]